MKFRVIFSVLLILVLAAVAFVMDDTGAQLPKGPSQGVSQSPGNSNFNLKIN